MEYSVEGEEPEVDAEEMPEYMEEAGELKEASVEYDVEE